MKINLTSLKVSIFLSKDDLRALMKPVAMMIMTLDMYRTNIYNHRCVFVITVTKMSNILRKYSRNQYSIT